MTTLEHRLAARVLQRLNGAQDESPAARDAVLFARRCGFEPDPWQETFLRAEGNVLLNCTRQSGKSTTAALKALHKALYTPGSMILLLSPSLRQSGELFRKVLDFWRVVDHHADSETKLTLELPNGSRILSLPGKEGTIRGFSGVDLLLIDEAARVDDDLYRSVRPMLAVSGGSIIAPSTPWGKRGWWFEAWTGGEDWQRFEIPATQCPRISAAFLAQERREMGEWWFNQEYMCQFEDAQTSAFAYEDVQAMFREKVEAWAL